MDHDCIGDLIAEAKKLTDKIREMPNWDEEPEEAWDHFDKIVEARVILEHKIYYYEKYLK